MAYPDQWKCPICGTVNEGVEKCTNCTFPKLWKCPRCENDVHDSLICQNCGYNALDPKKSKIIIKKSWIVSIAVIVYFVILGAIIYFIMTQDKIGNEGELLKGETINITLATVHNYDKVTFIVISPSDVRQELDAEKYEGVWKSEMELNESGYWTIRTIIVEGDRLIEKDSELKVNSECTKDYHCIKYGEDYRCNTAVGVCVQHKPDIFDFLEVIGIKSLK